MKISFICTNSTVDMLQACRSQEKYMIVIYIRRGCHSIQIEELMSCTTESLLEFTVPLLTGMSFCRYDIWGCNPCCNRKSNSFVLDLDTPD